MTTSDPSVRPHLPAQEADSGRSHMPGAASAPPLPVRPALIHRDEDGARLGALLWRFGPGWRMISSAMLGGGIGPAEWVLNAQVPAGYSRMDPVAHLISLSPEGPGVGMLTAAVVARYASAADRGAQAVATVGLGVPTWAASPEGVPDPGRYPVTASDPAGPSSVVAGPGLPGSPASAAAHGLGGEPFRPGTINIVVAVPVAFCDAALVNAVMTVTEAKTQALIEAGFPCTGTASDAVCVAVRDEGPQELFGGPRSTWGARIARAVHRAVLNGALDWRRHNDERAADAVRT
jgi:adenosylcobinamide amidohydrolase